MNDWQKLRTKLCRGRGGARKQVEALTPEELLTYFRHFRECPYSGDPMQVRHHARKIKVVVDHADVFEVPREEQDFFEMHRRFDRFLKDRLGWVPPAKGEVIQERLAV